MLIGTSTASPFLTHCVVYSSVVLQDIIKDDDIKLDWFFKASMTHDFVNVSVHNLLLSVNISYCYTIKTVKFLLRFLPRDARSARTVLLS